MTKETVKTSGEREEEVQSNWVGWGKPGNTIKGTLTRVFKTKSKIKGHETEDVTNYEMKLSEGEFNNVDKKSKQAIEPSVVVTPGDIYNIGGRPILERQMRNVRLGTKIRITYKENQEAKNEGFADLKVIKVFIVKDENNQPVMDQEWLDEKNREQAVDNF